MRVVFVGGSPLAVLTASRLARQGHDVVIVDKRQDKIDALADEVDAGLVTGDGTRPGVLAEIGPTETDVLFCVSDRDEANILAALVGRSLGFRRVVPQIVDPQLEPICTELGLDDVMIPDRHLAQRLVDLVEGRDSPELTAVVEAGVRFLTCRVPDGVRDLPSLDLPDGVIAISRNRDGAATIIEAEIDLQAEDEVVLVVRDEQLDELRTRFATRDRSSDGDG